MNGISVVRDRDGMRKTTVRLDVRETLRFFDQTDDSARGHVSAVVAVLGEDLGTALLQRALREAQGIDTRVLVRKGLPLTPTTGETKGKRLDRWLLGEAADGTRRAFQVEVKSWSATAIGHSALAINADDAARRAFGAKVWSRYWSEAKGGFTDEKVGKVLHQMRLPMEEDGFDGGRSRISPPLQREEVKPVVCFWSPLCCSGNLDSLVEFALPATVNGFDRVLVFSASNYLRGVNEAHLNLEMPNAVRRIDWLNALCSNPE